MRTVISIVAGKSSTATSGSRKRRYFPTTAAGTLLLAMKRHSSNSVKIKKMETKATKPTRKLVVKVRKRLVSSRLGNPERPAPTVCAGEVSRYWERAELPRLNNLLAEVSFENPSKRKRTRLNRSITAVAIHSPGIAETELFFAPDSPSKVTRD